MTQSHEAKLTQLRQMRQEVRVQVCVCKCLRCVPKTSVQREAKYASVKKALLERVRLLLVGWCVVR